MPVLECTRKQKHKKHVEINSVNIKYCLSIIIIIIIVYTKKKVIHGKNVHTHTNTHTHLPVELRDKNLHRRINVALLYSTYEKMIIHYYTRTITIIIT